ncbi:AcrB/AcrD/AcrF family protein, partial [Mycobacterium tuberculosis]
PYDTWKSGMTKQELIARLAERYRRLPGFSVGFMQPMIDGVQDKLSGAHSDLVVKVYGDSLDEMRRIALDVTGVLEKVPGAVDVAI